MIKTARIGERVDGVIVDITVKNNKKHILAPTWDLVMDFKNKKITWAEYEKMYTALIYERLKTRRLELNELMHMAQRADVVLVCFCKDERFCHRRLAKKIIQEMCHTPTL